MLPVLVRHGTRGEMRRMTRRLHLQSYKRDSPNARKNSADAVTIFIDALLDAITVQDGDTCPVVRQPGKSGPISRSILWSHFSGYLGIRSTRIFFN